MPAKSFLFATVAVESGQLVPIFAVARELTSRGHRVRMLLASRPAAAVPDNIMARAEAVGCGTTVAFIPPGLPAGVPLVRQALFGWTPQGIGMPVEMLHLLHSRSARWAERFAEELRASPVDAVAADPFLPGAFVAAEAAGVPAVSLVHTRYSSRRPGLIPEGPGLRPPLTPIDRLRHAYWRAIHDRLSSRNALPGLNAARNRLGLPPVRSVAEQEDRLARVLVLSSAAFDFEPHPLPANVRISGWPIAATLAGAAWTPPWPARDALPLVLLSPSTTTQAQQQVPFFNRALTAMAEMDLRGVITVGPSAGVSAFDAPANVAVERFVPHASVLPRTAAIVSHCGHGTVMTALSYGVPIVCVPYGRDQDDNAARVVWAGAGAGLRPDAAVEQIRAALRRVVEEVSFKERAARLASAMASENGAANAADEIEAVSERSRAAFSARGVGL